MSATPRVVPTDDAPADEAGTQQQPQGNADETPGVEARFVIGPLRIVPLLDRNVPHRCSLKCRYLESSTRDEHSPGTNRETAVGTEHAQPPSRAPDDELAYYRLFIDQLLGAVREGDRESVERIVSAIRAGASQEEVMAIVSHIARPNGATHSESGHNENGEPTR